MRNSFTEIARFMDAVDPPRSLRRLLDLHRTSSPLTSFRDVWRRHAHPQAREERFLFLNTFLMDVRGDLDLSEGSKPRVAARATEIGRYVREHIDLAALCEVWTEREKDFVLQQWGTPPPHVHRITKFIARDSGGQI